MISQKIVRLIIQKVQSKMKNEKEPQRVVSYTHHNIQAFFMHAGRQEK
jgi:hypothetical protein